MKLTKYLSCFDNKRYMLDGGIHTLAIFIKIVLQAIKRLKKGCDKKIVTRLKRL